MRRHGLFRTYSAFVQKHRRIAGLIQPTKKAARLISVVHVGRDEGLTSRVALDEIRKEEEEVTMNRNERMKAVMKNKELVFRFVEYINKGDSSSLAGMMTDGFRFTDISGEIFTVNGMVEKRKFWDDYFQDYPDYRIQMDMILTGGTDVAFVGKTINSHVPRSVEINETLIWYAGIVNDQVSEWRIFSTEGYAF
jgi:hypothetical protein